MFVLLGGTLKNFLMSNKLYIYYTHIKVLTTPRPVVASSIKSTLVKYHICCRVIG